MAALDFPKTPTLNQVYTSGTASWEWDGTKWIVATGPAGKALINSNNLSDVLSVPQSRTNLGLGTMATENSTAVAITGGTINGTSVGVATSAAGQFTSVTTVGTSSQVLVQDLAAGGTAYLQLYRNANTCYLGIATDTNQNVSMAASTGMVSLSGGLTVNGTSANFNNMTANSFIIGGNQPLLINAAAGQNGYIDYAVAGQRTWYAGCRSDGLYMIYDATAGWNGFYINPTSKTLVIGGQLYFPGDLGGTFNAAPISSATQSGVFGDAFYGWSNLAGANAYGARVDITTAALMYFFYSGTGVGYIATNGTTTQYNTTSDIRLKDNVRPLTDDIDVGALIDAVEPVAFEWNNAPDRPTGHGFVAQALQKHAPLAVTEGVEPIEGLEATGRDWGVDASKLMPYVIAEMQGMRRRLARLEAE
jgi:hypothetical protein